MSLHPNRNRLYAEFEYGSIETFAYELDRDTKVMQIADRQQGEIICNIIDGKYFQNGPEMKFSPEGFTVCAAIVTDMNFVYLDVYFNTRKEAEDAKDNVIELCRIKAAGVLGA